MRNSKTPRQHILEAATMKIASGVRSIASDVGWSKTLTPDKFDDASLREHVDSAGATHPNANAMTRYVEGLSERAERSLHAEIRLRATGMTLSFLRLAAAEGDEDAAAKLADLNGGAR